MKRSLLLLLLLPLISGCGRSYTLLGLVTAAAQGPSTLAEVQASPPDSSLAPISGATVTLFHELDDGRPVRDSEWTTKVQTDAEGRFDLFDYATPGKENIVGLEISAPGFESVYITYVDYMDPDAQYFSARLRKKA